MLEPGDVLISLYDWAALEVTLFKQGFLYEVDHVDRYNQTWVVSERGDVCSVGIPREFIPYEPIAEMWLRSET